MAKKLDERARIEIDRLLNNTRLLMQSVNGAHAHAAPEVTLREFALNADFGFAKSQ